MNKKKNTYRVCPTCHISGFVHDGWTCTGRPHFICQGCKNEWISGKDGGNYYDNALTHPEKIIILGWTKEDYNCYNLSLNGRMIQFERKK